MVSGGNFDTILNDPWLQYEGNGALNDDARQSRCVYVGCSDCRTYFMGEQKVALIGALLLAGVPACEGLFDGKWNRYIAPGGGANISTLFPDAQRDRERIAFLVQHQLHGGETLVLVCHRDCGWVRKYHQDMSFAQAVTATIKAAEQFQAMLAEQGKSVRIIVVADRLHPNLAERYKVCAHLAPIT